MASATSLSLSSYEVLLRTKDGQLVNFMGTAPEEIYRKISTLTALFHGGAQF